MKFFNYTLLIQRTWKRSHKSVGSGSEYEASLGFLWSDCNILKTLTSWKESKTFLWRTRLLDTWEVARRQGRCCVQLYSETVLGTLSLLLRVLRGSAGNSPGTWENPEIPVGKSNGSSHSTWKASENMGRDLRWCNFSSDYFQPVQLI